MDQANKTNKKGKTVRWCCWGERRMRRGAGKEEEEKKEAKYSPMISIAHM